jgi:hypothetical protein
MSRLLKDLQCGTAVGGLERAIHPRSIGAARNIFESRHKTDLYFLVRKRQNTNRNF